ncbi:MAG: hypothetical protein ACI4EE_14195 [Lachnospiraceae bacterium]
MSKEEIGNSYRKAINQNAQIGILADLNCCSKDEIINILREQGYTVNKRGRKKKGEDKTEAAAEKTKAEAEKTNVAAEKASEEAGEAEAAGEADEVAEEKKATEQPKEEHPPVIHEAVRRAIAKEMCTTQDLIDASTKEVKELRDTLHEAEERLKQREADLEALSNYLNGEVV